VGGHGMPSASVHSTLLFFVLFSLSAPAAQAGGAASAPAGSTSSATLLTGDAHALPLGLFESALRYQKPIRPQATPEREAPALYPLHWAALTDQAAVAGLLIDRGMAVDARDGEGRTPLMVAAAFDSLAVAQLLLARGADPVARDTANGNTPLDFAAAAGQVEVARLLLAHGGSVDARAPRNGETPLHYAALYGHLSMIRLLIADGADIDAGDNSGVRPLQYARMRRQWLAVESLLDLGARPDDLGDAVNAGDVARVQELIARGADVNMSHLFATPLHLAAATGQTWIAGMLIDAGANLEAVGDPAGGHPLHVAALNDKADVARLLIDRGADLEARDAEGRTPLIIAAAYGNLAVGESLLVAGADPFTRDSAYRDTPIHWAVLSGRVEMVEMLISFGVDINTRSGHDGEPPLHYAMCDIDMVKFLVENGADPGMRDYVGETAMGFARGHNIAKAIGAIALLRRLGAPE
jgi:ankyrin repeat protein